MVMKDSNNPPLLELSLNPPPYHMDHMLSCMNPYGTQGHRVKRHPINEVTKI